ncbi:MAG: hypothetical protein V1722_02120 [Candidatus Micrarchaeota archaeon]
MLLPRENEQLTDYVLTSNKNTPQSITIEELPALFASTPAGKELTWSKSQTGELEIVVDSPGWVFVSQMWYPHFRVNGKPLYEAGGGLSAFYAETPGTYKIYWERPWYDYAFWAISIIALALLAYLWLNPEKHEKLISKLPFS